MSPEKPLTGMVAMITGASRGIGFAIARRLGQMGARISIFGRDAAKLEQSAATLRGEGVENISAVADVAREDQILPFVQKTQNELGAIDILVNNAGIGLFGPFHECSEADWNRVMDTNLKSVFLVSRAVVPEMIRRQTGHIINISSLAGKNTFANGAIYCASKWGLMGLSGSMAEDLRGYGIRVSTICPGSVATEFSGQSKKDPHKALQAEDIAHAVAMLVTQSAGSFISEVHIRPTRKP
ncbi:MAG TPA: SDR family NAD(P)-dependent oxidoreductase [Candidatus Acidoferrales bacterium]|jgi:3-oxoacyl-[acyl-carrier protein] reductase|nr:SDR family NAD(P)-dependent oxidoreductase [Candidatus Acidoferrales bacterium]